MALSEIDEVPKARLCGVALWWGKGGGNMWRNLGENGKNLELGRGFSKVRGELGL